MNAPFGVDPVTSRIDALILTCRTVQLPLAKAVRSVDFLLVFTGTCESGSCEGRHSLQACKRVEYILCLRIHTPTVEISTTHSQSQKCEPKEKSCKGHNLTNHSTDYER